MYTTDEAEQREVDELATFQKHVMVFYELDEFSLSFSTSVTIIVNDRQRVRHPNTQNSVDSFDAVTSAVLNSDSSATFLFNAKRRHKPSIECFSILDYSSLNPFFFFAPFFDSLSELSRPHDQFVPVNSFPFSSLNWQKLRHLR
ncbi:hypothetical protein Q1695_001525 [Nippostrongylus brasiliensis]|nr:hypothetical protein Q1695_001525 [Nippostrongylus brasiliensis]